MYVSVDAEIGVMASASQGVPKIVCRPPELEGGKDGFPCRDGGEHYQHFDFRLPSLRNCETKNLLF